MRTKIINILAPYKLQEEIEEDNHRFRVVACGRRWGKTMMAMREAFGMIARRYSVDGKSQRGWIIAPTFPLVREDWLVAESLLKDAITDKKETQMKMEFKPFGFLEFKSADREDEGLRGAGLDCAVIDEASRVSKKSWEQGIRPALADKQGKAIFISTPKGRNWFYDIFLKGKDDSNKEFKCWQHPTYTNPYFPQEEWKIIENSTPEMILKQEYLADFLEDEATVFKNISKCYRGNFEEPSDREYYTIGIDLGKTEDFTVITVLKNSTHQVIDLYRQNKLDWTLQKELIKGICRRYKKHIAIIDSTGLGDPIADDLRRDGINIQDYKFTNASKEKLIEHLIIAIEQGLIGIPQRSETQFLIDEIKSFTYEILPSGRIRYQAPEGLHDDGVISLGLAVSGIAHLLYEQLRPQEKKREWGTADDWERLYRDIDLYQMNNPFLTREEAVNRLKVRRFREKVLRAQ